MKTPKRRYKRNIWGNVVGYEGREKVEEFGCSPWADRWAEFWVLGYNKEAAENLALGWLKQ